MERVTIWESQLVDNWIQETQSGLVIQSIDNLFEQFEVSLVILFFLFAILVSWELQPSDV